MANDILVFIPINFEMFVCHATLIIITIMITVYDIWKKLIYGKMFDSKYVEYLQL